MRSPCHPSVSPVGQVDLLGPERAIALPVGQAGRAAAILPDHAAVAPEVLVDRADLVPRQSRSPPNKSD